MAFDKEKTMRAAEKYLSQGKISTAIKEYQQIVENDPSDYTVLNLLGDLYVRQEEKDEAVDCFMRVAEHYRAEGFALKAIAMYKKIDRLNPGTLEIAAKLAPLYQLQGLMVDARANYLIVADAYQRAGQAQKALDILRKIADLDPQNTEIRLKLAEGYQRENCIPEAVEAYIEAGARLLDKSQYERAVDSFNSALKLRPNDCTALSNLASTYIAMGVPDDAAELLENAVAEQPDNPELLSMLSHSYIEMENAQAAERATADLVAVEPSSYRRFLDVARVYLKKGDLEETMRVVNGAVEELFTNGEEEELAKILNEVLSRNPEQIEALKVLARVHTWRRDNDKLRKTLERLVDSAQLAGLVDEERDALTQLARLFPQEQRYGDRLQELGVALIDITGTSSTQSFNLVEEPVPSFDGFTSMSDLAKEQAQEPATGFEVNIDATPEPSPSFVDLNAVEPAQTISNQEFDIEFSSPSSSDGLSESHSMQLKQELESVDFYIAQGYTDIARSTLDMLEQQFGSLPEIHKRRQQLSDITTVTEPSPAEIEFEYQVEPEPVQITQEEIVTPAIDVGLTEIFNEFRESFEEEETQISSGDYETHYNLGLAYKDMDLSDEAIEEFQHAITLVAPQDGTARYLQCCNLLGHCFMQKGIPKLAAMWYRKGLDAPGHTEDEYQALRYDLGLAYEQMGEIEKAIDTFTEVYGVNVLYRNVADKLRNLESAKTNP
jgi:tetratricopeptide (TPR) repeat protein